MATSPRRSLVDLVFRFRKVCLYGAGATQNQFRVTVWGEGFREEEVTCCMVHSVIRLTKLSEGGGVRWARDWEKYGVKGNNGCRRSPGEVFFTQGKKFFTCDFCARMAKGGEGTWDEGFERES